MGEVEVEVPVVIEESDEEIDDFDNLKGYGVILLEGVSLGGFKASNGKLKNYYPKELRI